jgi:F-type H+-transporting ATPase subunit a
VEHHGITSWLLQLPLLSHDPLYLHVNATIVVTLFITVFSIAAYLVIKGKQAQHLVPSSGFSIVNMADVLMESTYNMIAGTLGHKTPEYFPFVGALFIFILFGNLIGLLPFSSAATSNPNTTLALGAAAFVYYNWMGIKEHGLKGYLAHFLMGLGPAGIFVAILEMVSHVIRPFSLGLRLFLNLHMDHTIVHTFQSLVAWLVPVPLLLFGIVVCTIQAFVFATLTAVYIQIATEHESH